MDEIWLKVTDFLERLIGENKSRKSYVKTPEFEQAEQVWVKAEQDWEEFLKVLPEEQKKQAEQMKDCMEEYASAQEKRSYLQGYVDCVQMLYHMGLL